MKYSNLPKSGKGRYRALLEIYRGDTNKVFEHEHHVKRLKLNIDDIAYATVMRRAEK